MKVTIKRTDLYATVVAAALFGGYYYVSERIKESEPIENWIEMKSIFVPAFAMGEDDKAMVAFDAVRKRPFIYDWIVTVRPIIENRNFLCFAYGKRESIPGDELPKGLSIKWIFNDKPCAWYPAQFKMRVSWKIGREGYREKYVSWESNVFEVLPEGAGRYVTPEQNQLLKEIDPSDLAPPITEP